MKKKTQISIFVLTAVLAASVLYAQFSKPEDAIKYRKSAMFMIAQHFKHMGAMIQGKTPYEKQAFTANAEVVKVLATLPWEATLVPGTDKGDTTLSPAVFAKINEFMKTAESFESATAKLAQTSKNNDLDAIKKQFGIVAQSCKKCHKPFRK